MRKKMDQKYACFRELDVFLWAFYRQKYEMPYFRAKNHEKNVFLT